MSHTERIERIEKEISGVVSLYNVTSWELSFMRDVKNRPELSEKQSDVLNQIERKVFDHAD